jgi:hypothetical protein
MSQPTAAAAPRSLRPLIAVIVIAAVGVGLWFYFRPKPTANDGPPDAPPLSSSPYLNTLPDATYVGSEACIKCHESQYKMYLRTGMSRSTAAVDPKNEPPDATFDDPRSGRRYRVERKNGQLWHREFLPGEAKPDVVLNEFPLEYAVGSGRFGKTYLTESDGFMFESPLSYYSAKSAWGMSPGYEGHNLGFERPVGAGCLYCHVGRTETEGQSMHRHRVIEPAVGCERCHGPGSKHVALREKGEKPEPDMTIVNPSKFERDLAESVCQQCHLSPELTVPVRGRKRTDFRPGLPLQDVAVGFGYIDAAHMTVTGHVEQLHLSKCYKKSGTLTCITCHDPHGFPKPAERVSFFRGKCQTCHPDGSCKMEPKARHAESADDNCVQCHMPRGATDIPHLAFSHHRIGIHSKSESPSQASPEVEARPGREALHAFHDLSPFGELDRQRLLGLAYGKAGSRLEQTPAIESYNRRADQLLTQVWNKGLRDGATATSLARARYWLAMREGNQKVDVRQICEAALQDPDLPGEDRCDVLFLLADGEGRRGHFTEAAEFLRQNTKLRRQSTDWSFLAKCESSLGHADEALRMLEHAATISPFDPRIRRQLIDLCEKRGDHDRAEFHRQRLATK